jgi:ketosteroid isomerase-like protein
MSSSLISQFYTAFQTKDYLVMQDLYHADATFSDPVFQALNAAEVKAMWQMLVAAGKDLQVTFSQVSANETSGSCLWEARYTFSRTGKRVHNIIRASFEFRDGKIFRHVDSFDFWRWSRQALGFSGLLLGWTPLVKNKVRTTARRGLTNFMRGNAV